MLAFFQCNFWFNRSNIAEETENTLWHKFEHKQKLLQKDSGRSEKLKILNGQKIFPINCSFFGKSFFSGRISAPTYSARKTLKWTKKRRKCRKTHSKIAADTSVS